MNGREPWGLEDWGSRALGLALLAAAPDHARVKRAWAQRDGQVFLAYLFPGGRALVFRDDAERIRATREEIRGLEWHPIHWVRASAQAWRPPHGLGDASLRVDHAGKVLAERWAQQVQGVDGLRVVRARADDAEGLLRWWPAVLFCLTFAACILLGRLAQ